MNRPEFKPLRKKIESDPQEVSSWKSPEGITVSSVHQAKDVLTRYQDFSAGLPPYLRGPYSTMYVSRPWTIRQYAGFSTAEESNTF